MVRHSTFGGSGGTRHSTNLPPTFPPVNISDVPFSCPCNRSSSRAALSHADLNPSIRSWKLSLVNRIDSPISLPRFHGRNHQAPNWGAIVPSLPHALGSLHSTHQSTLNLPGHNIGFPKLYELCIPIEWKSRSGLGNQLAGIFNSPHESSVVRADNIADAT
jgi:hypothetical protein